MVPNPVRNRDSLSLSAMSRPARKPDDLVCPISWEERQAIDLMKRMCCFANDQNVIRTALWRFSEHLDMKLSLKGGVFSERPRIRRVRR